MQVKKQQNQTFHILAINPGSTSTKITLFKDDRPIASKNSAHHFGDLALWDQIEPRCQPIIEFIQSQTIEKLDAVVGRGGLLKPLRRGVYLIDETLLADARRGVQGEHPSNLGAELAHRIAAEWQAPAFVVDPVSVDEMQDVARYSGHPLIERRGLSHALSIGAAADRASQQLGIPGNRSHLIIGHLGGGISIAAVRGGRIIDVNDASGGGPFSPERTGTLPLQQFIDISFSEGMTRERMKKMVMGQGGLRAYLGTSDLEQVELMIEGGDAKAKEVFQAMIYQIAKEISSLVAVLSGRVDGIVLTGGLVKSKRLVRQLRNRIGFIAPILIYREELEMTAMAAGALAVLRREKAAKRY